MSNYATRHHPDVIARKLSSGMPLLNDFSAEQWRQKLNELGATPPKKSTKRELYRLWRASREGR